MLAATASSKAKGTAKAAIRLELIEADISTISPSSPSV
jgi:hypothetical protein